MTDFEKFDHDDCVLSDPWTNSKEEYSIFYHGLGFVGLSNGKRNGEIKIIVIIE